MTVPRRAARNRTRFYPRVASAAEKKNMRFTASRRAAYALRRIVNDLPRREGRVAKLWTHCELGLTTSTYVPITQFGLFVKILNLVKPRFWIFYLRSPTLYRPLRELIVWWYSSCPQSGAKRKWWSKNVLRLLERMHICVRVQTADFSDKRGLVTRRIKASKMLQSIVCAFRSIAGAATAEKLVLSYWLQYKCDHQLTR